MLRECRWIAIRNHEAKRADRRLLRSDHALARRIEKHAEKIWKLTEKDRDWRALVQPVDALRKITQVRMKGAPRRLRPTIGAVYLWQCYALAQGKKKVPKSRSGLFARVLRIVYRVSDPMPIIKEIIASSPHSRSGSIVRLYREQRVLFERFVLAYKRPPRLAARWSSLAVEESRQK